MKMYTPNQAKPAPTFAGVQQNFVYRLRQFIINDQFTIIEDLPRTKPIRQAFRAGTKGQYTVFLIRISSGGFEADLELFEGELNYLAIACPKTTQNFKGATLAYVGRRLVYVCGEMPAPLQSDSRQPDLNPPTEPADQRDVFVKSLITRIQVLNDMGTDAFMSDVLKLASKICPGKEVDIVGYAKTKGMLKEIEGGVIKVVP